MKNLFLAMVSFVFCTSAFAYDGLPKDQVAAFFRDSAAGKQSAAIDNLYASNPVITQTTQQITLLKQQVASLPTRYGNLIGNETLYYEELSPSLIRIVQLAKHESHPVVWEFYFYKPKDALVVSQSTFGVQFQFTGSKK